MVTTSNISNLISVPKNKIVIAHDLDDWLFSFIPEYVTWRNKKYDTNYKTEDVVSYDIWKIFKTKKEDEMADILEFHKSFESTLIRPNPQALDVLRYLNSYKNIVITSRPSDVSELTRGHVRTYLGAFFKSNTNIILTNNFSKNGVSLSKASEAKRNGVIVAIDDSLTHATDYSDGGIICLLPDKPWNQSKILPENVYRFDTSYDAKKLLKEYVGI